MYLMIQTIYAEDHYSTLSSGCQLFLSNHSRTSLQKYLYLSSLALNFEIKIFNTSNPHSNPANLKKPTSKQRKQSFNMNRDQAMSIGPYIRQNTHKPHTHKPHIHKPHIHEPHTHLIQSQPRPTPKFGPYGPYGCGVYFWSDHQPTAEMLRIWRSLPSGSGGYGNGFSKHKPGCRGGDNNETS